MRVTDDDALERLLSVPLSSFVEERGRLAAALKAAGRRDEARELARLAKPSAAVWVVNQLARKEGALVKRFGELTTALRSGTAAADYARLIGEHRDALKSLRAAAERILVAAGHAATPAILERIVHSLRAGMTGDQTRAAIERGHLLREVGEPDFVSLMGAPSPASEERAATAAEAKPHAREEAARPKPAAAARPARDPAEARAAVTQERERERERARARAAAEREAERLRTQTAAARKKLAEEERALETARRALADREARVAAARDEVEALARQLAPAENPT
jgi:hypothetical protein